MQLKLTFTSKNNIIFDQNNIRVVQGFLYQQLSDIGARYIHADAYTYNNKTFRHFCFSDILVEQYKQGVINHGKTISFYFSTSLTKIIPKFCHALLDAPFNIGGNQLTCTDIEPIDINITNAMYIKTYSPVVVDRTKHNDNGKKYRYYYSPFDDEFEPIIKKNILDKYYSLGNTELDLDTFYISQVENIKQIKKTYVKPTKNGSRDIKITGYTFSCLLTGDTQLIKTALYSGFGAKNAQGFGFVSATLI